MQKKNMYKNKLTELLKELSRKDWNAFEDFVNSPIFNKSEQLKELLAILKAFWPDFTDEKLTETYLSKQLFPEKEANKTEKHLSNLTTRLLRLLEQFFAFRYWKKDENKQDNDFLQSLLVLNKNDLLELYLAKIERKRARQKEKGIAFYDSEFAFLEKKYRHSLNKKLPTKWANLQDISDSLDEAYILKKLKYACIIGKRQQIYEAKHEIGLLNEILQHIEAKKLHEKNDNIAIYYTCFQLLEQKKEAIAEKFLHLLKTKGTRLPEGELATLYTLLLSFYNKQTDRQYDKMLEIFLWRLNNGLLQNGKYLHYTHLYNLLILLQKLNRFDKTETFLNEYKHQIEPTFIKIFQGFSDGKRAFYEGNYEEASRHFEQIESSTLLYELDRRVYLLKIYFLTDEELLFEAKIGTFTQFLHDKKKMKKKQKEEYLNFIKIIKKFFSVKKLRNKTDSDKLKRLAQKIKRTEVLREKKWLEEEIGKRLEA